ncbi:MAG UNVERIFIED_CONTAM: PQQ-binding-like beta-propeller repeat protein [Planctomycetaceae bacterium]|jgi:outer membrane protein assembly factor BamB
MTGNAGPPKLLWTTEGFGGGYASVAVVNDVLYTVGNTDSGQAVLAASAKDGSIIWKQAVTEANPKHSYEGSRCTPTVVGDLLYVITSDGSIACLKTDGGAIVWQRKFSDWNGKLMSGWGFSESPLVDGDRVLCTPGGAEALVVCLNRLTGEEIWKCSSSFEGSAGKDGAGYSSYRDVGSPRHSPVCPAHRSRTDRDRCQIRPAAVDVQSSCQSGCQYPHTHR